MSQARKRERLEHAKHNESVCHLLYKDGNYNDWVVSTAYYAAVHYVRAKLFPLKTDKGTFSSFDLYYKHSTESNGDKHAVLADLVSQYLPAFGAKFKDLLHLCKDARYNDYKVHPKAAKDAYNKILLPLRNACSEGLR